ncbi:polysaccharide pyruvyl transferase family protein [Sinorhizobium sp. BJ1]|uniref:polysaccharide pyruvyl transferase family protein n=1 Tax=Sinorhizobium sp. BJ1 TaxID=2035455 RepID=UPI0015CF4B0C|nr:polysaccharide pyruvyl transferase family protein [Sinorhizobium sp. BJ1]
MLEARDAHVVEPIANFWWIMKKKKMIFICENPNNIGDLFLLLQNLEFTGDKDILALLRTYGAIAPHIRKPLEDRGVKLVDGRNALSFLVACWGSDVVIGGGQMIRDNVSLRGLAILFVGLVLTRLSGGNVKTRGMGVSPIRKKLLKMLWKKVLQLCDKVVVRDIASVANGSRLVARPKIELAADMAFLPSKQNKRLRNAADARPTQSGCVIIAPCIDEEREMGGTAFNDLVAALKQVFPSSKFVILCHDIREEMDKRAARIIKSQSGLGDAQVAAPHDLDTVLSYYEQAHFVVTNRLHSAIFSLLSGRPLLVWADNSEKLNGVCAEFYIPSLKNDDTAEKIKETLAASLSFNRNQRDAALRNKVELSRKNIY